MSSGSITHWLSRLQAGDSDAAHPLWDRYFQRLVQLARSRLVGMSRRSADEEDVAIDAFDSFCRDAARGRFPRLEGREDLWRLLIVITAQKASDLTRRERALKRGGLLDPAVDLADVIGSEPTPEFAAQVAEEFQRLLDALPDAELRSIAVRKMEGYSNEEIAFQLGCVPRTVERRLRVIRSLWEAEERR